MSNNGSSAAGNGRTSANKTTTAASYGHNISASGGGGVVAFSQRNPHVKSISFKGAEVKQKCHIPLSDKLSTTTAAAVTAIKTQTKANNNDNNQQNILKANSTPGTTGKEVVAAAIAMAVHSAAGCNINKVTAHRRDASSVNGQNAQNVQQQQAPQQSLREPLKYRYVKPQTVLSKSSQNELKRDVVDTTYQERMRLDDDPFILVYYDDSLVSGSLEALINHMVPTHDYYPDCFYIFAFLLSARLFIRPHELLAKISQIWEMQQLQMQCGTAGADVDEVDEAAYHLNYLSVQLFQDPAIAPNSPLAQLKPALEYSYLTSAQHLQRQQQQQQSYHTQKSAQNCIRLLANWIETFPYDFRDERLMQQVRILTRKCVYIDNALGKQVSRMLQLLVQRLTALEQYEEFLQTLQQADNNGGASTQQQSHYSTSAAASASYSNNSTSLAFNNLLSKAPTNPVNSHQPHHHPQPFTQHSHQKPAAANFSMAAPLTIPASYLNCSASAASTTGNGGGGVSDATIGHNVCGILDKCASCAQLAHQLTAIELERLSHIGPEEFVQAFAKEYQNTTASNAAVIITNATATTTITPTNGGHEIVNQSATLSQASTISDMKKTRNLECYVDWFNRLSYLTASEIVKYSKKKQRVRIIEYWIETARECFNIGNFNSLMAIIAGLNLSPISRLKKTWAKVQSAKYSVLEHQMDPTSNFNSYRSTLKAAMWRSEGATEERERIIIPFFSLFVKDLYFLNEGCNNRLPNNHLNFEKCSQLAKQVMEFNEWKKVTCPFEKLPNIITYLQNTPILNETTLAMASFECEPPENTEEKDRYKTVKAETKQQLLQQLQEQQLQQQQQQQQKQQ